MAKWIVLGLAIVLLALGILFLCRLGGKHPEARGKEGECIVSGLLKKIARPQDKIINDIILFNPQTGKSSQIDHIFITGSGVYVIETKNYSGYIYGNESAQEWTEVLAYGKIKNRFYSPYKQNNTHLYLVGKLLGKGIPLTGIVVFTGGNLQYVDCKNTMTVPALKTFLDSQTAVLLSPEEIRAIYEKIILNRDTYQVSQQEHLDNIRKTQLEIDRNICPRCGGTLVVRHGKNGDFYGCSSYPSCKFTKKL